MPLAPTRSPSTTTKRRRSTVSLPASADVSGGPLTGTITSSRAPDAEIVVQLASSDTTQLTVPPVVILPAGQTSVAFTATPWDNHVIEPGPTPVTVTALMDNWTSGSATVNVSNDDRTMTLTVPASGWAGQVLSGAGTVRLGGTLSYVACRFPDLQRHDQIDRAGHGDGPRRTDHSHLRRDAVEQPRVGRGDSANHRRGQRAADDQREHHGP